MRQRPAWELIGWDDGPIRIVGGRTLYEAVMFSDTPRTRNVRLARIEEAPDGRLYQINRYVPLDTMIEIMGGDDDDHD